MDGKACIDYICFPDRFGQITFVFRTDLAKRSNCGLKKSKKSKDASEKAGEQRRTKERVSGWTERREVKSGWARKGQRKGRGEKEFVARRLNPFSLLLIFRTRSQFCSLRVFFFRDACYAGSTRRLKCSNVWREEWHLVFMLVSRLCYWIFYYVNSGQEDSQAGILKRKKKLNLEGFLFFETDVPQWPAS